MPSDVKISERSDASALDESGPWNAGIVGLPRRDHQVDRLVFPVDVNRRGQEVGVGADGVGQRLLLEDEGGRRLDLELVRRGLTESRARAQEAIEAGLVLVSGARADRAGASHDGTAMARVVTAASPAPTAYDVVLKRIFRGERLLTA